MLIINTVLWPCPQYMETISSRQMDMQKFIADGCREALLEEKRRFCFLADKHCMFSYQTSNFHEKVSVNRVVILRSQTPPSTHCLTPYFLWCFQAKEILSMRLPSWQEKCSDITKVPDTVTTMIEELSNTPEQSPLVERYNRVRISRRLMDSCWMASECALWDEAEYYILSFIHLSYTLCCFSSLTLILILMLQIKAVDKSIPSSP